MNTNLIINSLNFEKYGEKVQVTMLSLFSMCDKFRLKKIGIGKRDKSFKDSKYYAFNYDDSIFVDGCLKESKYFQEPFAWIIASEVNKIIYEKFGQKFSAGCGNAGQYQINKNFIIPGIYKKINNNWIKIS